MFVSTRFAWLQSGLRHRAAEQLNRVARHAEVRTSPCNTHTVDEPITSAELFIAAGFLDFGGVPTELLKWCELRPHSERPN